MSEIGNSFVFGYCVRRGHCVWPGLPQKSNKQAKTQTNKNSNKHCKQRRAKNTNKQKRATKNNTTNKKQQKQKNNKHNQQKFEKWSALSKDWYFTAEHNNVFISICILRLRTVLCVLVPILMIIVIIVILLKIIQIIFMIIIIIVSRLMIIIFTWRMWEHKLRQEPSANQAPCRPAYHQCIIIIIILISIFNAMIKYWDIAYWQILVLYIDALLVQNPLHACRSVESKLWSPLKWRTSWGRRLFLKKKILIF